MVSPNKETLEREIKFGVEQGFVLPRFSGRRMLPRVFTSTYYDTEGYRLAQGGITLRFREERRKGLWQLKLPKDDARWELEFLGDRQGPPDPVTALLVAHLHGDRLRPIARLRTRRTGIHVRDNASRIADVMVDSVAVLDGRSVSHRFYEVEIELAGDDTTAARRIEKALRNAGAATSDQRPKVFQALNLASPTQPTPVLPTAPPIEHLKAALQTRVKQLLARDPGTRIGRDAEDVHQMRVATRRLRAILRAVRPMVDDRWAASLRGELAWLGSMLGRVRDVDVLLDHLRKESATLSFRERRAIGRWLAELDQERVEAHGALVQVLDSQRYLRLLDHIGAAASAPMVTDSTVRLTDIARTAFKGLQRAMNTGSARASDQRLHRFRLKGKRARYSAELAEATIGKAATRYIRQLQRFQDLLGDYHDAVVAEQRLRKWAAQASSSLAVFAFGRLIERQSERRRADRARLSKVWMKVQNRGRKALG